jgi:hypothetical protein
MYLFRNALLSLIKEFIFSNINQVQVSFRSEANRLHLPHHSCIISKIYSIIQGTLFRVLDTLSKFDKQLVLSAIPASREAILSTERKRGVGTDTRLRYSVLSSFHQPRVQGPGSEAGVPDLFTSVPGTFCNFFSYF